MKYYREITGSIIVSILLIAAISTCIVCGAVSEDTSDSDKAYYALASIMLNPKEDDKTTMMQWIDETELLSEDEKPELKQNLLDAWERFPDNTDEDLEAAKLALDIAVDVAAKEKAAEKDDSDLAPEEIAAISYSNTYSIKESPGLIEIRGDLPVFSSDEEKQEVYSILDALHNDIREDIEPYVYPNGPIISNGWNIEGCYSITFSKDMEVTDSQIDKIYELIIKKSMELSGKEVTVAFLEGNIENEMAVEEETTQSATPGFSALSLVFVISLILLRRNR
ncbi:hypothetical protein V7O61_15075 [Methanolobus sp. WCC1]|uniref:hypothetical protein n=1 Tax=unclassified Methanolobus TaxID=2629569 RepID=UPI0032550D26